VKFFFPSPYNKQVSAVLSLESLASGLIFHTTLNTQQAHFVSATTKYEEGQQNKRQRNREKNP